MDTDETKSRIVLLRLFNGDMVIGSKHGETGTEQGMVSLDDPRLVVMVPPHYATDKLSIALVTVCSPFNVPRLKRSWEVSRSQVMYELDETEMDAELVNGYKSEISGIKIASAAETAAVNSQKGVPGEFVL